MECSPTLFILNHYLCTMSQSPSIMECSPTETTTDSWAEIHVAVPVNYGMLSYRTSCKRSYWRTGRSPRQLWNALLRICPVSSLRISRSQSPSIMECSPTLPFFKVLSSKTLRLKNEPRIVTIHVSDSLFMRSELIKASSFGSLIVSENSSQLLLSETKLSICDSECAKVA